MLLAPVQHMELDRIDDFDDQFGSKAQPVVLSIARDGASSRRSWTINELVDEFGFIKVPVRQTDDEFREFFAPTSRGVSRRMMMELRAYVETLRRTTATGTRPPYAANISLFSDPAVAHKFDQLLAACHFPNWRPEKSTTEYRLWIGAAGQRSTIHNDPYHNFNAQIIGRKRFILFEPGQHGTLYPFYFNRGMWTSPIQPFAPDLQKYPKFAVAQGFDCTLDEGEVLFVPRFWWHYAEAATISVNINLWIVMKERGSEWWHQQQQARPFVSYEALLLQERRRFQALPVAIQDSMRKEFQDIEADLLRLMEYTSKNSEEGQLSDDPRRAE